MHLLPACHCHPLHRHLPAHNINVTPLMPIPNPIISSCNNSPHPLGSPHNPPAVRSTYTTTTLRLCTTPAALLKRPPPSPHPLHPLPAPVNRGPIILNQYLQPTQPSPLHLPGPLHANTLLPLLAMHPRPLQVPPCCLSPVGCPLPF